MLSAYLPRTSPFYDFGDFIADVSFPVHSTSLPGDHGHATVQVRSTDFFSGLGTVSVDTDGDGVFDEEVETFYGVTTEVDGNPFDIPGLQVAVGFGLSPLSTTTPHLLLELSAPIHVTEDFRDASLAIGGPFTSLADGVVCPVPVICPVPLWDTAIANNLVDPPASRALITIEPDGSTVIDTTSVFGTGGGTVPTPGTLALFLGGLAGLGILRRVRRA